MENINIEPTEQTLEIHFNFNEEKLIIKGESYPENSLEFFEPLLQWIDDYFAIKDSAAVEFEIDYLNSSSYKSIFDIVTKLGEYNDKMKKIDIKWFYPEDDEDLLETGEDLSEETSLEITYIKV